MPSFCIFIELTSRSDWIRNPPVQSPNVGGNIQIIKMVIDFYTPQSEILKKYIFGYYFLNAAKNANPINYWTFPNNFCILSVNLNSTSTYLDNKINVVPEYNNLVTSNLVYRYSKPIEISIKPPINEITIYFKPLGLNYFVNNLPGFFIHKNEFNFSPFQDFEANMADIFVEKSLEKRARMFERYWISKLNNKNFTLLESILVDIDNGVSVENIAKAHNYTRQYILKLFQSHIGKSIAEYRKIHRFRNSIRKKVSKKHFTELAYDNEYFDQSHFIKDFKGLTDLKPTTFFKEIDVDKPTIWHFIK